MKKNLLVLFIIIISLFSCSKDTIKEKTNFKTAVEYEEKEDYENAIKYYKLAFEFLNIYTKMPDTKEFEDFCNQYDVTDIDYN